MENWEFRLQKEGDRSWLPLESPDVEILEGRYRVIARSSRAREPVEIRITHQSTEEFPPKRRVMKRSGQISPQGAIALLPFTLLKPGLWELRIVGEPTAENQGEIWQESIRLQVLPIEAEAEEEFEPTTQEAETAPTAELTDSETASPAEIVSLPLPEKPASQTAAQDNTRESLSAADSQQSQQSQQSQEPTAEALPGSPTTLASAAPSPEETREAPEATDLQVLENLESLELVLDRDTYMVAWGDTFTLSGRVEIPANPEKRLIVGVELYLSLRDPQSGELLAEVRHPLSGEVPPFSFACPVEITAECNTHLILGEATLQQAAGSGEPASALYRRSFTIAADVDNLLGAIASDMTEDDLLALSREDTRHLQAQAFNQSFVQLSETLKTNQPVKFQPAGEQTLPPQLYQSTIDEQASPKPLELPSFPSQQPSDAKTKPKTEPKTEQDAANASETPVVAGEDTAAGQEAASDRPDSTESADTESRLEQELAEEEVGDTEKTAPLELDPVDMAFRELNLQERFLSRLSDLARDTELLEWLQANVSPAPEESESETQAADLADGEETEVAERSAAPESEPIDWEAQEIVVDDEPLESVASAPVAADNAASDSGASQFNLMGLILPRDEPVPTPELKLSGKETIAGQAVTVVARLPHIKPRIYVKFWINDRQTRTLIDGPHWIAEFWPTGMGDMEGKMEVTIPYGALEIELEAIAVEMQTQRESHKNSIERTVEPPRQPSLPMEDFSDEIGRQ